MSTNFYARHIPTEQEYNEMKEALDARDFDKLQELLDKYQHWYHIGKRSDGWQFLFVPHTQKYVESYSIKQIETGRVLSPWEDTLASIKEYLSRDDVQIVDEYDKKFTVNEFFNNEISYCLYHDKDNAINGKDYDSKEPFHRVSIAKNEYTTEEGLRFAIDDNWS